MSDSWIRFSAGMSPSVWRLVAIASTMLSKPSHVRRTFLKLSSLIRMYVPQNDASWMKGSNWPVFSKYIWIKLHVRSSEGRANTLTSLLFGVCIRPCESFCEGWDLETVSMPPPAWLGEASDGTLELLVFTRAMAREICRMNAMFEDGPEGAVSTSDLQYKNVEAL